MPTCYFVVYCKRGRKILGKDKNSIYINENLRVELLKAGVDMEVGLKYCGDVESYMQVLGVAVANYMDRVSDIERYCHAKDYINYTIAVHALKNSTANIGAKQLSELATSLEMAGREDNISFIKEKTGELLEQYIKLNETISELIEYTSNNTEMNLETYHIEEKMWYDSMLKLQNYLDELETDFALELINELLCSDALVEAKILLNEMKSCLDKFDIEGAKSGLQSLVNIKI